MSEMKSAEDFGKYLQEFLDDKAYVAIKKSELDGLVDDHNTLRKKLSATEKLAIEVCEICLINSKNQNTIDLINRTLKELKGWE